MTISDRKHFRMFIIWDVIPGNCPGLTLGWGLNTYLACQRPNCCSLSQHFELLWIQTNRVTELFVHSSVSWTQSHSCWHLHIWSRTSISLQHAWLGSSCLVDSRVFILGTSCSRILSGIHLTYLGCFLSLSQVPTYLDYFLGSYSQVEIPLPWIGVDY